MHDDHFQGEGSFSGKCDDLVDPCRKEPHVKRQVRVSPGIRVKYLVTERIKHPDAAYPVISCPDQLKPEDAAGRIRYYPECRCVLLFSYASEDGNTA